MLHNGAMFGNALILLTSMNICCTVYGLLLFKGYLFALINVVETILIFTKIKDDD